ncbi:competence type IV pilus minor pilin ComGG [Priestia abyssalis]|uniref:competence type IV pilus minor pilin ComGG n=1 Tax=Priestia abyssalis TaxID=1221450 RepID=UPI0009955617|nr:competence type IV pilus minor pilin ComGG [Priestia abyssalis]
MKELKWVRNERGFVLPLALLIALLVFFVVHQQLQVYVSEALFAQHVKNYYQLEHLLEAAMSEAPYSFDEEGEVGRKKTYAHPQGEVTYTLQSWQNDRMMVEIHCILSPEVQMKALAEIEPEKRFVIDWKKL